MVDKHPDAIHDDDVFALTTKGQNELDGSATSLAPSALEVLVLIDGKATVGETVARARAIGQVSVVNVLGNLLYDGLIEYATDQADSLNVVDFFATKKGPVKPSAAAIAKARKETSATRLLLHEHGYAVRIARRAKAGTKLDEVHTNLVLVIEDEQYLANMLKHVLANEGFDVRIAKNREEIVAAFRQPPRPDLVLLDVMLPDADGFEVLLKIRQHPQLQAVPVVMLTAKATREAVLKGLAGGADGYITKPFEIDVLVKAVNVVLGLSEEAPTVEAVQDPWRATSRKSPK